MPTTITRVSVHDLRFPTSKTLDGSDAMNPDPDYSAAYVILHTDRADGLAGHGMTFTIGRGNELCCQAIESLAAAPLSDGPSNRSPRTWGRSGGTSPVTASSAGSGRRRR